MVWMGRVMLSLCLFWGSMAVGVQGAGWDGKLMQAVRSGDGIQVRQGLAGGLHPDGDKQDGLPLLEGVKAGQLQVVKILVEYGARTDLPIQGMYPLAVAIQWDRPEIADYLAQKTTSRDGLTQGMIAWAGKGDINRMREMLDRGADLDGTAPDGTALVQAARNGQIGVIRFLLSRGADPNKASPGMGLGGPEHPLAAALSYPEIVAELVKAGGNINIRSGSGDDPLLVLAAMDAPLETVRILVDAGADIQAVNRKGTTALAAAKAKGRNQIVQYLENVGAR